VVYNLHSQELSTPWNEQPRRDPVFKPSLWTLAIHPSLTLHRSFN
jgi:hypothetical protein